MLLRFMVGPISFLLSWPHKDEPQTPTGPFFQAYLANLRARPWWARGQYRLAGLALAMLAPAPLWGARGVWALTAGVYGLILLLGFFLARTQSLRLLDSGTLAHLFLTPIRPEQILLDLRYCILWNCMPATLAWAVLAVVYGVPWIFVLFLVGLVQPAVFAGLVAALAPPRPRSWGRVVFNWCLLLAPAAVVFAAVREWPLPLIGLSIRQLPLPLVMFVGISALMIWGTVLLVKVSQWSESFRNRLRDVTLEPPEEM